MAKSARGKKTKEDLKEEVEVEEVAAIEPMFESNGQWFIIGNRSINNLNLSGCNLTENSLKIINELVMELESTTDATPDGCLGLIRVSLQDNQFQASHPLYQKIEASLLALNPFIEKS